MAQCNVGIEIPEEYCFLDFWFAGALMFSYLLFVLYYFRFFLFLQYDFTIHMDFLYNLAEISRVFEAYRTQISAVWPVVYSFYVIHSVLITSGD